MGVVPRSWTLLPPHLLVAEGSAIAKKVGAVILAAGKSTRLGRPKQLLDLGGTTVLQHVVNAVSASGLDEIVVVLGHAADEIEARLQLPSGAKTVRSEDYLKGQSASLKAGLDALSPEMAAAVVVLGDQPGIDPSSIRLVIKRFHETGGPVVQASYEGTPGHPVIFDRKVWDHLRSLEGDVGARDLLRKNPDWVERMEIPSPPPPDLDTWEDFEKLKGD